ncbi:serine protease FAM111A-like [Sardina pilchardus]|uniref:serine protease FAM111A-like n=1 Tax=Sardina pilchardus TaxID=27697 RepID=UPI002E103F70
MADSKLSRKTFQYSMNGKKPCTISADSSSAVLRALLTDHDFKKIYDLKAKAGMDALIQRQKANSPAISVHFPCCLLEDGEELEIDFMKCGKSTQTGPNTEQDDQHFHSRKPEDLVVFLVNTTGRKGIKNVIMKNNNIRQKEVHYVCVVAVKGETVKQALRRDGRFAKNVFIMDFALEDDEKTITKMKNSVDELKKHKLYSIVRNSPEPVPDSLEMLDDFNDYQSESNSKEGMADSQPHSRTSDGQSSGKASGKNEINTTSKSKCTNKVEILGKIPNTGEILKILRDQFGSLVQQLKAREGFKSTEQVREFLREEFSKETQGFSEIKTLKNLMERSASVCQVRHNDQARGTGFLLFGRFILTNAHVITDQNKENLLDNLSVSFNFEDLSPENTTPLKRKPTAYGFVSTQQHSVDFALLELKKSPEALPPSLLQHYSAPPVRGGVCIIGHPGSGVKKMDTCLIIDREKHAQAVEKHAADHSEHLQVIGEAYFNKKQELDGSQVEYNSCFFHGSSGSPVFDEHCNVIGIHTGGYVYKKGKSFDSILEYALPLLPVLVSILRQTKDKHKHVWESFSAENNTKLVMKLAEDMAFRPDLTSKRAWEKDLLVNFYEEEDDDEDKIKEEDQIDDMDVDDDEDNDKEEKEKDEDDENTEGNAKKRKLE